LTAMYLYGLRVPALAGARSAIDHGDPAGSSPGREQTWPTCGLRTEVGAPPSATGVHWAGDTVRLDAQDRFSVLVRADPLEAVVTSDRRLSDEELVHPVMAFVGAAAAGWAGRSAFHAATLVVDGAAWLLVGPPESGKSTLSVHARHQGWTVMGDDVAVLAGRTVLAGPRTADLREESARHWDVSDDALVELVRPRWRQDLGPSPLEAPLGGIVELAWGPALATARLGSAEKLGLLARHDALGRGPASPTAFLDLLGVPAFSVTRPRDLSGLEDTLRAIESLVRSAD
jgi:hypothetical protein